MLSGCLWIPLVPLDSSAAIKAKAILILDPYQRGPVTPFWKCKELSPCSENSTLMCLARGSVFAHCVDHSHFATPQFPQFYPVLLLMIFPTVTFLVPKSPVSFLNVHFLRHILVSQFAILFLLPWGIYIIAVLIFLSPHSLFLPACCSLSVSIPSSAICGHLLIRKSGVPIS